MLILLRVLGDVCRSGIEYIVLVLRAQPGTRTPTRIGGTDDRANLRSRSTRRFSSLD